MGVERTILMDCSKGLPQRIYTPGVVDLHYSFYDDCNLEKRSDHIHNMEEIFAYDAHNRLTDWDIYHVGALVSLAQNGIIYNPTTGNIASKSDVGYTFSYGEKNGKPHALTSLSGKPATISSTPQSVTYTDFKKVQSITEGTKSLTIDYGVDEQRRKSHYAVGGSTLLTRYYFGDYEEEVDNDGKIRKIHYISGGDGLAAIYIQSEGRDTLHYAYTDYQGTLVALADNNGAVKERYAFDPWGNRRNPAYWHDGESRTNFIVSRGYTGHEHLDAFRLINMNGRVYDPYMSLFMSPDPYVQAPGNWVNYNRYLYCYGNPMSFTDPSGEFIWAIALGVVINATVQGVSGNLRGVGDFFKAAIIGALSGAAGAGASIGVGALLGTATTLGGSILNGAIAGAAGGFAGGYITGVGNAWSGGASFGKGIKAGIKSGFYGSVSGAVLGGVSSGIQFRKQILIFQRGCEEIGVNPTDAVSPTDKFLKEAQEVWYKDAPMDKVNEFTVEEVPDNVMKDLMKNNAPGGTKAITDNNLYTGKSDVYFNKHLAFNSAKQLYFTMGHELVHVSQYAFLANANVIRDNSLFDDMLEFHAYSYQSRLGGSSLNSFSRESIKAMINEFDALFKNLSYTKFSWTTSANFKHPF